MIFTDDLLLKVGQKITISIEMDNACRNQQGDDTKSNHIQTFSLFL